MLYRGDRQRQLRKALKLSQTKLAEKAGVTRFAIAAWESGANPPTIEHAMKVARILGTSLNFLMGEDESIPEYKQDIEGTNAMPLQYDNLLMVPMVSPEVRLSAGIGNEYTDVEWDIQGSYPVYDGSISAFYSDKDLLCMRVEGDSMEPQIHDNDIVVFNHDDSWVPGNIYVVCLDGRMMVKGLVNSGNNKCPILRSTNRAYIDIQVHSSSFFMIYGRVLMITTSRSPKAVL